MVREEVNKTLRNCFENILNYEPTEKELIRKKEIDKIARQEKEEYEKKRAEFYNNPLHWSNNKRRRYHLSTLRGSTNKDRSKCYPSFHPTARLFCAIEDMIDEVLTDKFSSNEFFGRFVDVKDVTVGEANVFYVSK